MKIPTIVGFILVILLVGGIIVFFEQVSRSATHASPTEQPEHILVTNIADTGFTVTWTTQTQASGVVIAEASGRKPVTAFDERDQTGGTLGKYTTHSISLQNLSPSTDYTIKLLSNGKVTTNGSSSYRVTTGPTLTRDAEGLEPAYGTIITTANTPAQGALVMLTVEGGQTLSSLTKPSGTWLIPLNLIRDATLRQYLPTQERMGEQILVRLGEKEIHAITDTLNDAPVPVMILGKTYDFRNQQAKSHPVSPLATNTSPNVLGVTKTAIGFIKPEEGASLTTFLPLIQGTGIAGKTVAVTIGITHPTSGKTTVGNDQLWRYTPPKPLLPGKQSVTITTTDAQGKPIAMTRAFTILRSGTQVLGDATPSATLIPTPTTSTETPTPVSTLSGEAMPQSGTSLPTMILLIMSVGFLASGVVFALL